MTTSVVNLNAELLQSHEVKEEVGVIQNRPARIGVGNHTRVSKVCGTNLAILIDEVNPLPCGVTGITTSNHLVNHMSRKLISLSQAIHSSSKGIERVTTDLNVYVKQLHATANCVSPTKSEVLKLRVSEVQLTHVYSP